MKKLFIAMAAFTLLAMHTQSAMATEQGGIFSRIGSIFHDHDADENRGGDVHNRNSDGHDGVRHESEHRDQGDSRAESEHGAHDHEQHGDGTEHGRD